MGSENGETCLVGVTMRFFRSGEKVTVADLNSWEWPGPDHWDDGRSVREVCGSPSSGRLKVTPARAHVVGDLIVESEMVGFRFDFMGDSSDEEFSSPIERWYRESGGGIFDDFRDDLIEMAGDVPEGRKVVRLVTAWGRTDEGDMEFLGEVNLKEVAGNE